VHAQTCIDSDAKLEVEINLFSFAESAVFGIYDWSRTSNTNDVKKKFTNNDDWTTHKQNYCLPANRLHEVYVDSTSTDNRADGQITSKINGHTQFRTTLINDRFQSVLQYSDRETCINGWTKFKLVLEFGDYPQGITWDLKENGVAIFSSFMTHEAEKDSYSDIFYRNQLVVDQCVRGGDYEFIIQSSQNNGLYSQEQRGTFELYADANRIDTNNGNFNGRYSKQFSLDVAPDIMPGFCFSGESIVRVKDSRGEIPMKHLQLGDEVQVEEGKYERVYSFGHREEKTSHDFLRLLPFGLELTPDHMVFLEDGKTAVPASNVQVGDRLLLLNNKLPKEVQGIEKVRRHSGVYAPFTYSGKLIVNDVTASSYIAFQNSKSLTFFLNNGSNNTTKVTTPFSWFWIAHSFTFPHRFWCSISQCNAEEYTAAGVSKWVDAPYRFILWLLDQHPLILFLVFLPLVFVLLLLSILDFLVFTQQQNYLGFALITIITAICVVRRYIRINVIK